MIYLSNAISLQMINGEKEGSIVFKELSADEVVLRLSSEHFFSAIGHEETAQFLTEYLGIQIDCNRCAIKLSPQDVLIVAQYTKGRLDGKIQMDIGALKFYEVRKIDAINCEIEHLKRQNKLLREELEFYKNKALRQRGENYVFQS